jgi:hypothetical protein
MADDSPSKASAFFIDRLVQPMLGGLNPSFTPVSENGKPGLSLPIMTRNFRRFSARFLSLFHKKVSDRVELALFSQYSARLKISWHGGIQWRPLREC